MSGKQTKPKKAKQTKHKNAGEHDEGLISTESLTVCGGSLHLPTDSQARDGETETVTEKQSETNDYESASVIDDKPVEKGDHRKTINDQSSRGTENAKTPKPAVQREDHPTMYIVFLISTILTIGATSFFLPPSSVDDTDIENSLQKLANDFQNQSPASFKKLRSRVMPYIHHKTSPQPFVLLVASTQDNKLTAECFATRVAKLLATSPVSINGSKYMYSADGSDDVKKDIDNRLRDVFHEGKFPTAAVIHNLDSIPYGTTNLFYAYCDHDNPMYKEAAIIFTITLPENYQITDNEVDREGLVEKYLSEHSPWVKDQSFSIDIMGALISRITDTVIVVNKESREALHKSC